MNAFFLAYPVLQKSFNTVQQALAGILQVRTTADDNLVFGVNLASHVKALRDVLQRLADVCLTQ